MDVPDGIQPLLGYREWRAWYDPSGRPMLMSVVQPGAWPHRAPLRAICHRERLGARLLGRDPAHRSPEERCRCGIYALRYPDFDPCLWSRPDKYVMGLVAGWGRYVLAERGWRSEFARPIALLAHPRYSAWVERAARLYDVDVMTEWPEAAVAS